MSNKTPQSITNEFFYKTNRAPSRDDGMQSYNFAQGA